MRVIEYKASFKRALKKLPPDDRSNVKQAVKSFLLAMEAGQLPTGLGLKRLYEDRWEIRADIRLRVCFRMAKDLIEFALVGDHEMIKNYLKNL